MTGLHPCLSWTPGWTNSLHLYATSTMSLQPKLDWAARPQFHMMFWENNKSWWDLGCSWACSACPPYLPCLQSRGGLRYLCQPQRAVGGGLSRQLPFSISPGSNSDLAAMGSLSLFADSAHPFCLVEGLPFCQTPLSAHRCILKILGAVVSAVVSCGYPCKQRAGSGAACQGATKQTPTSSLGRLHVCTEHAGAWQRSKTSPVLPVPLEQKGSLVLADGKKKALESLSQGKTRPALHKAPLVFTLHLQHSRLQIHLWFSYV